MVFPTNANVLVGLDRADDAGVYKVSDALALIQTVDFFTPIVDDPYAFGQIAAANALSDIFNTGERLVDIRKSVLVGVSLKKAIATRSKAEKHARVFLRKSSTPCWLKSSRPSKRSTSFQH